MPDHQRKRRGGPGRPRLNRDLHAFRPKLELELYQDLELQAGELGISLSAYSNAIVSLAFGYEDPYLPTIGDFIPAGLDQLREYAASDGATAGGASRTGPNRSLGLLVDRRVANQVEDRAIDLGISYADVVRGLLRVSQYGTDPAPRGEQGSLDLEGVAV